MPYCICIFRVFGDGHVTCYMGANVDAGERVDA